MNGIVLWTHNGFGYWSFVLHFLLDQRDQRDILVVYVSG